MTADADPSGPVSLASEPDFRLGVLQVSPSACRVRGPAGEERLEPRVMEVLVLLARAAGGTVSRDRLIEACWGGRIVSDDAVARIIAKVRAVGRDLDPAPFTLETIPKVGFRLTPSAPVAPTSEPERAAAPPEVGTAADRLRRLARSRSGIAALLGLAAATLLALAAVAWLRSPRLAEPARIEVMAFSARSPDPIARRIATTTPEEIVRVTSGSGMEVAPHVQLPGAGDSDFHAVFRVTGSVDRDGELVVVNAQVIDRPTGQVLWSVQFTRPEASIRGFEQEIARSLAGPLQCALEDRRHFRRPMPPSTFVLYLNACDAVARQGAFQRMLKATRRLAEAAPDEPTALAMHAIALANVARLSESGPADVGRLRREAAATAERALRIDRKTPKAYLALALAADPKDYAEQERRYLQTQNADPTMAPGRVPYALMLRDIGRLREGLNLMELAADSGDTRDLIAFVPAVFLRAQTGDVDGAREILRSAQQTGPDQIRGVDFALTFWWDRPERTLARLDEMLKGREDPRNACYRLYLERLVAANGAPLRGLPEPCEGVQIDWRIRMLARQGDVEGAYAELDRRPGPAPSTMYFYPEMKAFRADPRFLPLMARVGLLDDWVKTGRWPDFCKEPDRPYDCEREARRILRL